VTKNVMRDDINGVFAIMDDVLTKAGNWTRSRHTRKKRLAQMRQLRDLDCQEHSAKCDEPERAGRIRLSAVSQRTRGNTRNESPSQRRIATSHIIFFRLRLRFGCKNLTTNGLPRDKKVERSSRPPEC